MVAAVLVLPVAVVAVVDRGPAVVAAVFEQLVVVAVVASVAVG